jgi:chemotaxis response regulator CheB
MTAQSTSVLVASRDGDYRRLAGAALAGAGFDVRTVVARAERVERILADRLPDVLVLDASPASVARIDTFIGALERPPALVVVAERGRGSAEDTDKWCPPAALVDAVATARRRRGRRRLHIVR